MLYKYVASDRVDVLERQRIRFTQPVALNDPFELRPYFETVIEESYLVNQLRTGPIDIAPELAAAYKQLAPHLKATMSLDQFLSLVKGLLGTEEGQRQVREQMDVALGTVLGFAQGATDLIREQWDESFGKQIGLLSLSEVPDSALMWAHYAQRHVGFVIGFNEAHEFFDRRRSPHDEFYHLRRVVYREPKPYRSVMELDGEKIFLVKSPEWHYEREWRMMAPLKDATETIEAADPIALFAFPPSAIRAIIAGARASEQLVERLRTVLNHPSYHDVELLRASLDLQAGSVRVDR